MLVLVSLAISLSMTNLLATTAIPAIVLHKTSLMRSKGRLAFLEGISNPSL